MYKKNILAKVGAFGAVAIAAVSLAACGNSKVAGTWYHKSGYIYRLDSNGTWSDNAMSSGTYKVRGDKLTLIDNNGNEIVVTVKGDTWEYEGEKVAGKQ